MRPKALLLMSAIFLSGCAERFLHDAESAKMLAAVPASRTHLDIYDLNSASRKAARLSYTYLQAAGKVITVQDAASALVILSAAATAYGVATEVSGDIVAGRAIPGIGAGIAGRRYASKETVEAIYSGARRLNCISAKAGIASSLGNLAKAGQEEAAVVATRAAMMDVQLMTREDVVREVANFKELFDEIGGLLGELTAGGSRESVPTPLLDAYIAQLQSCLALKNEGSDNGEEKSDIPEKPAELDEVEEA